MMAADGSGDSETETGNIASDQKIRDSCNACSSHKIRCTKERPACRRCASKGLFCEYSISRRNGKRRRSDAPNGLSVVEPTPGIGSSTFIPGDDFDQLCELDFRTQNPPTTSDDSWILEGTSNSSDDVNMHYFEPRAFGDFNRPTKDADDVLSSGPVVKDVDGSGFGSGASMSVPQPLSDSFMALFGQAQDFRSEQIGLIPDTGRFSRFLDSTSCSTSVPTLYGRGQDCTAHALRIVTQMHVAPKSCKVSDSASVHCGTQSSRGDTRDIDTVLQVNRDAIQVLNKILDCPSCSGDPTCMLTCYLAVQKTVAWYAAILGLESGVSGSDLTDLVSMRPIFMGTFALDREAQRLVHASVILAEIRDHVQPLVARLSKPGQANIGSSSALPSPSSSPSASCGAMADRQRCVLHEQVSRIVAKASPSQ